MNFASDVAISVPALPMIEIARLGIEPRALEQTEIATKREDKET